MEQTVYSKEKGLPFILLKALVRMKLTVFILLLGCLQASAFVHAQSITLSLNKVPFPSFIKEVEAQTGYRFVYLKEQMEKAGAVTLHVVNSPLLEVLSLSFKDQPLDFTIEDKLIIIRNKKLPKPALPVAELRGRVVNREGEPMAGVSIRLKDGSRATVTDESGEFTLQEIDGSAILEISGAEIEKMEVPVNGRQYLLITVKAKVSNLDQVIVMAYGQTTQRLNTGNIVKVTAEEIELQPVSNPLAALQGRVPGMVVTQTSGVPGSAFKVEIRGRSSLDLSLSRNDPLFIIDGVPFEQGNQPTNQFISAANQPYNSIEGGLSPLNTINPSDIESIEVLKDADATSIYGSRGANGVILITTKKAQSDKLKIQTGFYYGRNDVTRLPTMMNTAEYLAMRREAFKNDDRAISLISAPDLMRWDTTNYTDFSRIVKNTAHSYDAQLSMAASGALTSFMLNGGFHRETSVFSKDLSDKRISLRIHLSHQSLNKKFNLSFGSYYVTDNNRMIQSDLTQYLPIPPQFLLYDSLGNPNFRLNGASITSVTNFSSTPAADLLKKSENVNEYIVGNLQMNYELSTGLFASVNAGYNVFTTDEKQSNPIASISPLFVQTPYSRFGASKTISWITEPQLKYNRSLNKHGVSLLAGATLQQNTTSSERMLATGFSSDFLLYSPAAATNITASRSFSQYKYLAIFSRLTYNYYHRYIANLSLRRDGSSRFGPGKKFSTFGSVAGGWIFSEEPFIKKNLRWLSFGKLRSSFGTSGNDQIGDYRYLDLWNIEPYPYESITSLSPSSLYNPDYTWEITRKFETALETGFLKDRIQLTIVFFRNRSGNQLIHYQLPYQTGFQSVIANFPALVENRGWEFAILYRNIRNEKFKWSSSFNLSIPQNRLISFPDLSNSSYSNSFKEGHSLNSFWGYHSLGVNPEKGIYEFLDENKDGVITQTEDYQIRENLDPQYYGGFQNSFQYKNWSLDIIFEGKKQLGLNYIGALQNVNPGQAINLPVSFAQRWQNPGDISNIQQYTTRSSSDAGIAGANFRLSDGIFSDASYLRLKTLALSFVLNNPRLLRASIQQLKLFLSAQNLLLITPLKDLDPETQRYYVLPPMRTISAGIQITI